MRILIVGAGIAGLATHRALSLRGFNATIVERSNFAGAAGAGLYLPGNAVRAIRDLGLLDELLAHSQPITRQRFCDERGQVLNVVDTDEFWRDVGPCRSLKRSVMWDLLKRGLGTDEIQYRQVVGLRPEHEGWQVRFEDGAAQAYDLVIGADGVNSTVRGIAFPDAPLPAYVGNLCWRFVVPNISGVTDWTVMLAADRSLLGIPVSSSEVYIYADLSVDASAVGTYSSSTPLEPLFRDGAGTLSAALKFSAHANVHFGQLVRLRMVTTYRNRMVLVGDAAHASPPSMAQGAGMAFEDALVLAEELARTKDVTSALAGYAARRTRRIEWVHRQGAARDKMRRLPRSIGNLLLRYGGQTLYQRSYRRLKGPI